MSRNNSDYLESPKIKVTNQSVFIRFLCELCPCIDKKKGSAYRQDRTQLSITAGYTETNELHVISKPMDEIQTRRKDKAMFKSVLQGRVKDELDDYEVRRKTMEHITDHFPILNLHEGVPLLVGKHPCLKFLTRVDCIRLSPTKKIIDKCRQAKMLQTKSVFTNPKIQRFWSRRYALFEKFDMGIRIDQDSWDHVLPQAVAEHIAEKIHCNTILDAYCGVGSASIQFAKTCRTVFSANPNLLQLECLEENSRIYSAENITKVNEDFLKIKALKCDAVFLWPEWPELEDEPSEVDPFTFFKPELRLMIEKAMTIGQNIVVLLRPSIDIDKLGQLFSVLLVEDRHSGCSMAIQKIFFMDKLQYIVVYYGSSVNREVRLGDELEEVYRILNDGHMTFHHVRVVKAIRELFGMAFLLQLACQAKHMKKNSEMTVDSFYNLIKTKKLISTGRLQNLISQQKQEPGKVIGRTRPSLDATRSVKTQSYTSSLEPSGIMFEEREDSDIYQFRP